MGKSVACTCLEALAFLDPMQILRPNRPYPLQRGRFPSWPDKSVFCGISGMHSSGENISCSIVPWRRFRGTVGFLSSYNWKGRVRGLVLPNSISFSGDFFFSLSQVMMMGCVYFDPTKAHGWVRNRRPWRGDFTSRVAQMPLAIKSWWRIVVQVGRWRCKSLV